MRHDRRYVLCYLVATTVLFLWPCSAAEGVKEVMKVCDPANLDKIPCGKNERCVQEKPNVAQCLCERGFELQYDQCVLVASTAAPISANTDGSDEKAESGGGSVAAGLLIPTFLIVIGVLLYFGARRYKWLQRFRQFRQNRYGNVLVTRDDDEDDDPPIA